MNKDTQEALKRLEEQLLAEEPPSQVSDEDLDAIIQEFLENDTEIPDVPQGYQNYANGYRAYNSDQADADLDGYSDEVYEEPEKLSLGLLTAAGISLLGSAAAVIYMVVTLL